jgi:UDP-N-acetylglucosamine pyrophosphorylase
MNQALHWLKLKSKSMTKNKTKKKLPIKENKKKILFRDHNFFSAKTKLKGHICRV